MEQKKFTHKIVCVKKNILLSYIMNVEKKVRIKKLTESNIF